MVCLLILLLLVELPFLAGQVRLTVRLIYLLRHPGRIAQFGLDARHVFSLCYWPGAMLLLLALYLLLSGAAFEKFDHPLLLMTFSALGLVFALGSWTAATLWLRSILRRDLAVYREPTALVPVAVLAAICLTYAAAIGWVFAEAILAVGGRHGYSGTDKIALVLLMLPLAIPLTVLANFALVVIHVGIVRAARTWGTCVPHEEDEIP